MFGALVGASGGLLTKLMADAMNRSIANIVIGGVGTGDDALAVTAGAGAGVRAVSVDDLAIQLADTSKVIIVPGRMPGCMNVLLAEADVPYLLLKDMDEIKPEFPQADVALVIGADDVTNPAARRPGNAISGMPILDVDKARSGVVINPRWDTGTPASTTSCTPIRRRHVLLRRRAGPGRAEGRGTNPGGLR